MSPGKKLSVMVKWPPAVTVTRMVPRVEKLCYVVTANKIVAYNRGRSKIVYIGATDKGLSQLVANVAHKTGEIFANHDMTHFEAHVVTCKAYGSVPTWYKLERALLLGFRDLHDAPPLCNSFGGGIKEEDEFSYFAYERIRNVLEDLG
jgi:hypothetical protein